MRRTLIIAITTSLLGLIPAPAHAHYGHFPQTATHDAHLPPSAVHAARLCAYFSQTPTHDAYASPTAAHDGYLPPAGLSATDITFTNGATTLHGSVVRRSDLDPTTRHPAILSCTVRVRAAGRNSARRPRPSPARASSR